ncbi:MAG: transposase [Pyrinomonadaceae bacterium]
MKPHPFYTASNCSDPAYSLRFTWTGWLAAKSCLFPSSYVLPGDLVGRWESDELRLLEAETSGKCARVLFSVKPSLSPIIIATLAKGRLQYELRKWLPDLSFSRKVSLRSINSINRDQVDDYLSNQVKKDCFVDQKYRRKLDRFTWVERNAAASAPTLSRSGRYWYDLHLVFRTAFGLNFTPNHEMERIRDTLILISEKHGHRLRGYSLMPDHLHIALRGNIGWSPETIALNYMNNLAYAMRRPIWQNGYYAGTFGDYSQRVISRLINS